MLSIMHATDHAYNGWRGMRSSPFQLKHCACFGAKGDPLRGELCAASFARVCTQVLEFVPDLGGEILSTPGVVQLRFLNEHDGQRFGWCASQSCQIQAYVASQALDAVPEGL